MERILHKKAISLHIWDKNSHSKERTGFIRSAVLPVRFAAITARSGGVSATPAPRAELPA